MSEPDTNRKVAPRGARGVLNLSQVIQGDVLKSLDLMDLYQVAATLQPLHPEYSITELAKYVAEIAVKRGSRYFVWDPPQG